MRAEVTTTPTLRHQASDDLMRDLDSASGSMLHAPHTVGEIFIRAIRRYGSRVAIQADGLAITYSQLGERISQFMQVLADAGVRNETGVCVLISNRPEAIMIRAAILLLGARYTPLNPLGAPADHGFIIRDADAEVLIVENRFMPVVEKAKDLERVRSLMTVGAQDQYPDLMQAADEKPARTLRCEAHPLDIAGINYTGGTTGSPKGIIHSHRVLVMNALMSLAEWDWPPKPDMALMTPLAHASGYLTMPVLVKGGTLHILDGFDAGVFLRLVEREQISATFLVPTMIHALINHPLIHAVDLSSLKLIIYGAAPISVPLLQQAMVVFGPIFLQLYAQSEAPMTVTTLNSFDHQDVTPGRLLSCGFPMLGVDVRILDDDGAEATVGQIGEVCVRGPLVMEGYWSRPEENLSALRDDWLHTGDVGYQDEQGYLYIVDRKKDMIITGGFNVYPKEVEDALMQHSSVVQAAVFGIPDAKWGEAVKAVVVLRPGAIFAEQDIIDHVRNLKGAVSTPKSIDPADTLPQTPLGKVDKQILRAPYWRENDRLIN